MYKILAVAALYLVQYEFFTPPVVVVAQVRRRAIFAGEVQGTGTVNVDVVAIDRMRSRDLAWSLD